MVASAIRKTLRSSNLGRLSSPQRRSRPSMFLCGLASAPLWSAGSCSSWAARKANTEFRRRLPLSGPAFGDPLKSNEDGPQEMQVIDHEPSSWFLVRDGERLFLDVNCSHGAVSYDFAMELDQRE